MKTITKQLSNAKDWIPLASLRTDKPILHEIVCGCIKVLQQSAADYNASGHVVRLAEYVRLAQLALPVYERPLLNSHSVARMLRARGHVVGSHSDSQRVIANVSLTPVVPKPYIYVVCGPRLARIYHD